MCISNVSFEVLLSDRYGLKLPGMRYAKNNSFDKKAIPLPMPLIVGKSLGSYSNLRCYEDVGKL